MASTAEVRKQELVEQIVAQVHERLSGADAEEAARFVRKYYAPVAPKDVLTRDLHHLTGAVLSLWRFAEMRTPGQVKVRVYNPTLETDGFRTDHTVAEVINDDMPFLVDSVTGELNRRGRAVHVVIHPIVPIRRDDDGRRVALCEPSGGCPAESLIHVELDQETSPEALAELERALESVLADVRVVVDDWRSMRQRVAEILEALEGGVAGVDPTHVEETQELLRWIDDNHFTFLGYREYELEEGEGDDEPEVRVVPGSGLGLLRHEHAESFPLSPESSPPRGHNPLLTLSKAGRRATVHRTVHMDYVGIRRRDDTGRAVGGWSFLGLLTSGVYHSSASEIPVVRRKIDEVMERAGLPPASHDAKALLHILETFPRDELFQMTEDQLYETSLGILQLQDRQRLALFVRRDPSQRFVSCLVYVPRDRYNTDLRTRMQDILADAFDGELSAFYTQVTDAPLARAHFIIRTGSEGVPEYDVQEIENRLAEAALAWTDRLRQMLVVTRGEDRGLRLMERFGGAFPVAYREAFDAAAALYDIDDVEAGYRTGELRTSLYRPADMDADRMRFKIFHPGNLRPLSDVLPMLENMGLEVVFEVPYRVRPAGETEDMWIRDLVLASGDGTPIDLDGIRKTFRDTFARVWNGEVEDDSFNRLVLSAQLQWRQVVVLRAYARYLRQVGLAYSQEYMAEALGQNPNVARLLVRMFETRFDPSLEAAQAGPEAGNGGSVGAWAERERRSREVLGQIRRALNEVDKLDQDRILRRFRNLIESTLRTNYFQTGADGKTKPYVSFKMSCRTVQALPRPRPLYEVFVYSPQVEAVHLRGGRVARGGIRWSDRPEDFRTEVLNLMKAQMVKNAVIVPVGAKGGFIVKQSFAPTSHEERAAAGVEAYKTMVRGLLDLTDNLDGDAVIHPRDLVRWDDDDPYLVVAADKGTATFSDIANSVASEYGFWLGDAFASGGSAGYDHKRMGITAKGAWESVKRHFREMGKDVQSEPFTAVGVGDMSGDVFGNGMLLSEQIRLVGAFNHQHVFLDPDPDPAMSHAERKRLFELSRSTWDDYDRDALSDGGGVFDRSAKSVPLSPQVQEMLGLERKSVNPNELVKALLRTPVDLLWLGGIGTFVKATTEAHAQTGDRHNDDVRVDAPELGARVVGEGANLGLTQRARIEHALGGGRINTDFIDNSGGVDCSDHEVNIKILLGDVLGRGEMTLGERNELLQRMTGEVSELVLRNNYLQTQAISVAEVGGVHLLDQQIELMRDLEAAGKLERDLEQLPGDEELERRRQDGRGLTRPEIAVLLAYGKIDLYEKLLQSDLLDDPLLLRDLYLYFPTPLRERFREELDRHRLRREIIATYVTSSMVNRVGPTFVTRLAGETGRDATDIARAYTVVRESFDLRELWTAIEELDLQVPAQVQIGLIHDAGRLVEWGTLWLLRRGTSPLNVSAAVDELKPAVQRLRESLDVLLPEEDRRELLRRAEGYAEKGVPKDLGLRVAGLEPLGAAFDVTRIARGRDHDVDVVGRIFFHLGSRFQLEWLRTQAQRLAEEGPWAKAATDGLVEHFFTYQRELTESVLEEAGRPSEETDDSSEMGVLERWLRTRRSAVSRIDRILDELRDTPTAELSMLMVVDHQMRLLLEG